MLDKVIIKNIALVCTLFFHFYFVLIFSDISQTTENVEPVAIHMMVPESMKLVENMLWEL